MGQCTHVRTHTHMHVEFIVEILKSVKFISKACVLIRYSITVVLLTNSWRAHYFPVNGMHNEGTCLIKHCCSVFEGFGGFFSLFVSTVSVILTKPLLEACLCDAIPEHLLSLSVSQSVLTLPMAKSAHNDINIPPLPLPGQAISLARKASRTGTAVSTAGA